MIQELMVTDPALLALICGAVVVLFAAVYTRITSRAGGSPAPPGPWGLPVVGSLLRLDSAKPYESLRSLAKRYGPVYQLYLGGVRAVVLAREDLIRTTFGREAASGRAPLYLTFGIMDGMGLICSEGELWREHRRFTIGVMRSLGMRSGKARVALEEKILHAAKTTAKELGDDSEIICVDPNTALLHSLGNSMNLLIFGIAYDREDPVWLRLQQLLEEGSKLIGIAGAINFLPWLRFLPHYRRTIKFIKENQVKSHAVYEELIENFKINEFVDDSSSGPKHVVDAYLKEVASRGPGMEGSFTRRQLHYVAADLFGAGTETTLTTLRWLLLDMANNVQTQTAVYNEVLRVAGDRGHVTTADLSALVLTRAALLETQRLHPVVPIGVPHGATEDIEIDGYHIPRGTMLIPLLAEVHMDPRQWQDPDLYRPERFVDSTTGGLIQHNSFMPFQAGRRVCPGEDFARMVLLLYLTQIILHYELRLPKDCQPLRRTSGGIHTDGGQTIETEVSTNHNVEAPEQNRDPNNRVQKRTGSSVQATAARKLDTVEENPLKTNEDYKQVDGSEEHEEYFAPEDAIDEDPFCDPICGFTATARSYKLVLVPRGEIC